MRFLTGALPLALIAAALAAGCGSDESSETTSGQSGAEMTGAQESGAGGAEAPVGVRARTCKVSVSDYEMLRVTGVDCRTGAAIAAGWAKDSSCRPPKGQSRSACSIGQFRCLTTVVGRGLAVTCARPERSVAFIAKRG
jgi:hypothetical protein